MVAKYLPVSLCFVSLKISFNVSIHAIDHILLFYLFLFFPSLLSADIVNSILIGCEKKCLLSSLLMNFSDTFFSSDTLYFGKYITHFIKPDIF